MGSPDVHKVLFEPSKHLWWVWDLILNMTSLLPSSWASPLLLDVGCLFFGGILHSFIDSCSAESFNFGVLTGEDERRSFYSTIYIPI